MIIIQKLQSIFGSLQCNTRFWHIYEFIIEDSAPISSGSHLANIDYDNAPRVNEWSEPMHVREGMTDGLFEKR